ncbi:MAG: tRNA (adenosine(37)-N6)-threonylcarbamoyltransferase complex dimerization subunit type 1 TsaB [Pseudomonadota bacterium]|nr:tRNA (adenosine(37)-N6)-threonylcarbamoyltransferase complex dimerization subunit type 1 TsaB [Pseudomonadota bacterium]
MKILAIDTASDACSAALGDENSLISRFDLAPRQQAQRVLPMVKTLLAEAGWRLQDLDALAFGRGPGSFTGVRVAASVAQGLAFGADLGVIPVSNLATLAQGEIQQSGRDGVVVAVDARMSELYFAAFRANGEGLAERVGEEHLLPPEAVSLAVDHLPADQDWYGVGSGWSVYRESFPETVTDRLIAVEGDRLPDAYHMMPLAVAQWQQSGTLPPEQAIPVYLRDQVAWKGGR